MIKSQPYRLRWESSEDIKEVNKKLTGQISKIDEMFEALFKIAATTPAYSQGEWTPIIGGRQSTTGQIYVNQVAKWIKIDQLVCAWGYVSLANKGTITGDVQIQGLPFVADTTNGLYSGANIGYFENLATNWISLGGYVIRGTTDISVWGRQTAGTTSVALTTADIANTTGFIFSVIYNTLE